MSSKPMMARISLNLSLSTKTIYWKMRHIANSNYLVNIKQMGLSKLEKDMEMQAPEWMKQNSLLFVRSYLFEDTLLLPSITGLLFYFLHFVFWHL